MKSGDTREYRDPIEDDAAKTGRNLLLVDDDANIIKVLRRSLRREGYTIFSSNSGQEGIDIMKTHSVGVVLSDYAMPGMDGVTFLEKARRLQPHAVRMLLTAHADISTAMEAVNRSRVFSYMTKPWSTTALKKALANAFEHYNLVMENKRLERLTKKQNDDLRHINENLESLVKDRTVQLEEAVREGVVMLALAAEAKDNDTGEHITRIQNTTRAVCIRLGLGGDSSEEIGFASIMHDVGKIHIPDHILKKKGPLNDEEWDIMKTHTLAGEKILGDKPFYETARRIARSHHERWDGSGYPDGLKGEAIPLAARIVTVADVFDALTSDRPYKKAWPLEKALMEMRSMAGTGFDPSVLNAFFDVLAENPHKNGENR